MPIQLNNDTPRVSTPVVKRTKIGERFVGAVVRTEQRDVLKDGKKVLKANGKPRQEMVVYCVAMPKTTAVAGIGDHVGVPDPGDEVRLILRGGAFGDWIEARKSHRGGHLNVGDVVVQVVEFAQAYDASGNIKGGRITDQAAVDALPRQTTIGFYGPLSLHEPKDAEWVEAAEAAYHRGNAIPAASPVLSDEEPF
jgi:hypothetical protein